VQSLEEFQSENPEIFEPPTDMIPLGKCEYGGIYEVASRNLWLAVFVGPGFIGVREKFRERYLFTEYHRDIGPPIGTVKPHLHVGVLPDGIELHERSEKLFLYLEELELELQKAVI